MRVPAALLALPLLAGASAGVLSAETFPDRVILASAFASVLCWLAGTGFNGEDLPLAATVCACVGSSFAGYSMAAASTRALLAPPLLVWFESEAGEAADPVVLEGRLREDAPRFDYGATLTIDVESAGVVGGRSTPLRGGARLVVGGTVSEAVANKWRAGRRVRVTSMLRYPLSFNDPGVPDERRQLALRGIALTGTVKSPALVEITASGSWVEEVAASARAWTRTAMASHVGRFDERSSAVATAILIGDRTGLSEDDERRLQRAGTYHVIAISGGNIAVLTAVLVIVSRILLLPHRAGAIAGILVLLFYGEVAGGAASVDRAIAAAVLFLTGSALDQRGAPLNVLAVAAALAVVSRPLTLMDGGFLLSFGATAGIILGVPALVRWKPASGEPAWRRGARVVVTAAAGILAATVCAEIALAPIGAWLFSRVTFAGLALNFAAIPLMTAVQCGSMALLAVAPVSPSAADALGVFVHWTAWSLVESSSLVDQLPWTVRDVPPPAMWMCALYYVCALALLALPRYRRPSLVAMAIVGLVIVSGAGPGHAGISPLPRNVLRVVVLDVGQGDATIATLPDGRSLLVDAGGVAGTTFDIGARVVVPALRALRVRALHALVLTHGDPDHTGGAAEVLRRLPVANVWEGVPVPPHTLLNDLAHLAAQQRIAWRTVRPGDLERAGGVRVRVLHPPDPEWERQRVRNDDSVVLELRYGDVSIVLPGDIGREGEQAVLQHLSLAPLVVLKAAHHGSATSSGDPFLDAARPAAVIFSAGRNNRFNHPAPVVVDRFRRRGVEMFNTAHDGAVFVETDGRTVQIRGWRTGRRLMLQGTLPGR